MKLRDHLWDTDQFTKKYTLLYNIMSKLIESYRLEINFWQGKAKLCKWLRKAFKWDFGESCNNTHLGFRRNHSNFKWPASDPSKILAYSELWLFRYIQAYLKILSIIKAY